MSQIAADAEPREAGVQVREDLSSRARGIASSPYVVLALIVGACVAVYAPAMNDWFKTDDYFLLRAATLYDFPRYTREAFDFRDFLPLQFFAYRPLYFVTSKVLFNVFGLHPLPWHLFSLVLHCANAVLVWHICRRLSGSVLAAHVAAAIFGLHPVYTVTVSWISGFNSVSATTCQLVCVLAFLRFLDKSEFRWYFASLGAYTIGILYHQEIFLVCGVIYAYYLLTEIQDVRQAIDLRALRIFVPFATVMSVWLVVQGWNAHESGFIELFEPTTRAARAIVGVIGISLYPRAMNNLRGIHGVLTSLFLGISVLLAVNSGPRWRVYAFCAVWYGASLLLILLLFGKTEVLVLGALSRKVYPAGPALAIILAMWFEMAWQFTKSRMSRFAPIALGAVAALVLVLAIRQSSQYVLQADADAIEAKAFTVALKQAHPQIDSGATLHLAGIPPALRNSSCPFLCYVSDLVITEYDKDVQVEFIDTKTASDPAYVASLPPGDEVFCYRCE